MFILCLSNSDDAIKGLYDNFWNYFFAFVILFKFKDDEVSFVFFW